MYLRKNNRGKIEIMANILNLSTVGMKKRHLMFQANLSYEQLMHYIVELQGKGMLEQNTENSTTMYCTTEKCRVP